MIVAYLSLTEAERLDAQYCADAFPRRFARAKRYLHRADYLRCIGAGALLSGLLHIQEKDLIFTPQGKPVLPGGPQFSLSHSGEYTVLAADDLPIGADIEQTDAGHLTVAPRVYTDEELRWMSDDTLSRFFVLWTMKESVLKNTGSGLFVPPRSFSVLPLVQEGRAPLFGTMRYGCTMPLGDCRLSVCADRPVAVSSLRPCTAAELMNL